jgi:oxygen-independent coproporphyrinogen III oxidase
MLGDRFMGDLGVYIHYPWCRSRCPYCDFPIAVAPLDDIPHRTYLTAILDELALRRPEFAGRRLVSLYFGGGTPSLWPADCLGEAVAAVRAAFSAPEPRSPGSRAPGPEPEPGPLEITIEANPVDCTAERMAGWRAAGIDRVSIGVQSLAPGELVALGRDHRMGDGPAAVEAALAAGFERLSADLILGAPRRRGITGRPGEDPLAGATALSARRVPHLSVYELTVAEGTPLERQVARGEVVPEDEDRLADLYVAAHELLGAAGYEHYEVSSYARPGARAVHNALYWRVEEFLGLGSGASSFRRDADGGGRRWTNHRSVGRYLGAPAGEREGMSDRLGPEALAADRVWLGLRTSDGIASDWLAGNSHLVDWLGESGLAEIQPDRIRPTLRGFLYSDQVARRVLDEFRYSSMTQPLSR